MSNANPLPGIPEPWAAVLNVRQLALHGARLASTLQSQSQKLEQQSQEIDRLVRENQRLLRLADIGRRDLDQRKHEILHRLRAVVLYTGGQERLRAMERLLAQDETDPAEVAHWHQQVTTEFNALYPTRPCSRISADIPAGKLNTRDWTAYRLRVGSTE
ncbi:MAG: hypothetical protein ACE15F_13595 [bacterium]